MSAEPTDRSSPTRSVLGPDGGPAGNQSLWREWIEAFTDPGDLFDSVGETLHAWWWTRPWKGILLCLFGLLVLLGVAGGLLVRAAMITDKDLAEFYAKLADAEQLSKEAEAVKRAARSDESKSAEALDIQPPSEVERLFARRLIQLSDWNPLPYYVIAVDLARQGKLTQALPLMRKIAPEELNGYPPGHAWLALYQLTRGTEPQGNDKGRKSLLHHLSQGVKWAGTGPQLRAIYAGELERAGEIQKAGEHLAEAVKQDPRSCTLLASFMQRNGLSYRFQDDLAKARERLSQRVSQEAVDPKDLIVLAELAMFDGELAEAGDYIRRAEAIVPDSPKLPRVRSELLRREYRKSIVRNGDGVTLKLDLLDAALKADPTNPAIDAELNNLFAIGIDFSADKAEYLRQKAVAGNASAVTHLILANQLAKEGKFGEAIPHLEVGLLLAPKSPLLLNNLAYALASTGDRRQLLRAEKLISEAVVISGRNPDILETQGEIRLRAGKPLEAVAAFEKVLAIDRQRRSTRMLLVDAYRQAKLPDLADTAERQLQALEAAMRQTQPAPAASKPAAAKPPSLDQAEQADLTEAAKDEAESEAEQGRNEASSNGTDLPG